MTSGSFTAEQLGRPIKGPSALGGDWRRFLALTWTLAVLELKLKFFGSVLGYVWQLGRPLMMFGVLYVVFTEVARFGAQVSFYGVMLLTGLVLFTFFSEATSMAVDSVVQREGLVRKIHFPRMVIPLSVVLTAAFNLALNFVVVLIFMLASGVQVRASWLQVIPIVLVLAVFTTGVCMLVSSLYVRFRDVKPIWEVLLQVTFYASPIFYAVETIPSQTLQRILMCNPLAVIVQQMRYAVIDPNAPTPAEAIGGAPRLLIPITIMVVATVLGFWVFNREAPRIAEEL